MATNFSSERVILKMNPTVSSSEITNLQAEIGATKVTRAEQFGIDILEIPPGKVEETIAAYSDDPRIEYIERDYIITLDDVETPSPTQEILGTITPLVTTPNDPGYPQLWGLNNTGQSGGTPDADIDAPEAWDLQTGNANTVIGVIDTGVDYNHPDLVGNIWTNPGETAGDGIDNDSNGYIDDVRGWDFAYGDNDPMDVDGHGTHVSGTIAGKGDNSVGVVGVAWNAKIMPLKFLNDSGSGSTSNAILALNYATAKGVKLTNNSWGGGGYSQALYDAINTAGQQGALFIASAGNDYWNNNDITPSYPASYNLSNIISVASTTNTDALSNFSNYGPTSVDLGAPGSAIYSTTPGGNYGFKNGTSMASPHVTGGAALVWSQNPTWTAQQVKNRLLDTTDPKPALSGKTVSGGRLNINTALGGSTPPPPPPPLVPNDNFANRIVLSGVPVSTTGSNIGATAEPQEPAQSGLINSAWWSWTAPTTGVATFDTIGSNFDTWLSVFTGSDLPNLTLIGFDDQGGGNNTSLLNLNAIAGTTYQIAVDGWLSNTGQIALNINVVPGPPNDNFVNQILLTGSTATTKGSNTGATGEVGEPTQSGATNSVWWSWTAPTTGIYNIDTRGSNFDTWLSVFTGSAVNNLTLIGFDDQGGGNNTSLLSLNATAGTTYRIAVDGYFSATGAIQLNIAPPPPANDNFANQIALTGETATTKGSNTGATGEVGEPAQSGPINSTWWSWTAPTTGVYNIDTRGSKFDTYLSVLSGSALANLTLIGANDDWGGSLTSLVSLNATAGTTYRIAVDGYSSVTGAIQLNIAPPPPPNDNFANRIPLTGATANATGTNKGATGEVGEPAQSGPINSSWWTWTAPTTGNYTFDTIGSGSDTYLSLLTGTNLPSLALVAANDDGGGSLTSRITQSVTAGTTYQIAVDGWSDRTGPINLNIAPTPPGSADADKLTETANNTFKGEADKDILTGETGADTLMLPFAQSSVSASPDTDLTIDKKRDPLTEGGAALNTPSLFSPAADSPVRTLERDLSPVFTDANGALVRTQPLAVNSEPFGVAKTSPFADPYLVGVYEARPIGI